MAKVCLLFLAFAGCAPAVAQAPDPVVARAPNTQASPAVRTRVARLAPPFAARVASRRVDPTTDVSAALHMRRLAELARQ